MRAIGALCGVMLLATIAFGEDKSTGGDKPKPDAPAAKPAAPAAKPADGKSDAGGVLDFTVKDIDGKDVALSKYKGDVVLVVNVASKCGFTPQYKDLEALYGKYKDKGLRILAFPANNFMGQEPGANTEIKDFCEKNYQVTFDLFSKISVKGDDQAELYKFLTSKDKAGEFGGEIKWNFTKFLIGRDGKIAARFEPRDNPSSENFVKAVEQALAAPKPSAEEKQPAKKP